MEDRVINVLSGDLGYFFFADRSLPFFIPDVPASTGVGEVDVV